MENRKTALITGGTSGLGRALVEKFLKEGWNVATCGRRNHLIDSLILEHGEDHLIATTCDIRLDNQVSSLLKKIDERWKKLDLLVLNAGSLGPVPLPDVSDLGLMDLRSVMESNFFANFNLLRFALPLLNSGAIIVHITSDAANNPYPGWAAYGASKIAMDHVITTLNEEMDSLTALSFDPGDMLTDMHRMALPDEDPANLKDPVISAGELFDVVGNVWGSEKC